MSVHVHVKYNGIPPLCKWPIWNFKTLPHFWILSVAPALVKYIIYQFVRDVHFRLTKLLRILSILKVFIMFTYDPNVNIYCIHIFGKDKTICSNKSTSLFNKLNILMVWFKGRVTFVIGKYLPVKKCKYTGVGEKCWPRHFS